MARYNKKTKKKEPRYAYNPPQESKIPRIRNSPPSDANAQFLWRVNDRYIDYDYVELGWCNCDSTTLLKDVVKELQSHEGLTWQDVREKSKHNHSWKFDELPKHLQDRLKERELDYLPELYQIGLANKPRIWGFKDISTYYLIWYDPNHDGYKTKVK
jgi:hypothetical protein